MIVLIRKKYRIELGVDIERYVGYYCSYYPDDDIVEKLTKLSTKSLVKAYLYAKNNVHLGNYFLNLKEHLSTNLEKKHINLNGLSPNDFEDDSYLELATDYANE